MSHRLRRSRSQNTHSFLLFLYCIDCFHSQFTWQYILIHQFIVGDGATTANRCCCIPSPSRHLSFHFDRQANEMKRKTENDRCHLCRMPYITSCTWNTTETCADYFFFSLLILPQKQFFDKITFSAHYKLRVSIKTLRRPCAMTILYIPNWMISTQARKVTKYVAFISLSPKKKST